MEHLAYRLSDLPDDEIFERIDMCHASVKASCVPAGRQRFAIRVGNLEQNLLHKTVATIAGSARPCILARNGATSSFRLWACGSGLCANP